ATERRRCPPRTVLLPTVLPPTTSPDRGGSLELAGRLPEFDLPAGPRRRAAPAAHGSDEAGGPRRGVAVGAGVRVRGGLGRHRRDRAGQPGGVRPVADRAEDAPGRLRAGHV